MGKSKIINMKKSLSTILIALALAGCADSSVSSTPVRHAHFGQINSIAINPSSGLMAEAVSAELSNRGFTMIDTAELSNLMVRSGFQELEVHRPESLRKFKEQGIDAILTVKAMGSYDGMPEAASARLTSTTDGRLLAAVSWSNGFGGMAGSIADRIMRRGLRGASKEIADSLVASVGLPGARATVPTAVNTPINPTPTSVAPTSVSTPANPTPVAPTSVSTPANPTPTSVSTPANPTPASVTPAPVASNKSNSLLVIDLTLNHANMISTLCTKRQVAVMFSNNFSTDPNQGKLRLTEGLLSGYLKLGDGVLNLTADSPTEGKVTGKCLGTFTVSQR